MPEGLLARAIGLAEQGEKTFDFPIYDTDWEGEAYFTVSGQNANNSVRMSNGFFKAVQQGQGWNLTRRVDGKTSKTIQGSRPVGPYRQGRLGQRRPRRAVRHHHQRVAYLPQRRTDQGQPCSK